MIKLIKMLVGVVIALLLVVAFKTVTTTNVTQVVADKEVVIVAVNTDYFIELDGRKLKLTENVLDNFNLNPDEYYQLTYSYSVFDKNGGTIERIKPYGNIEG